MTSLLLLKSMLFASVLQKNKKKKKIKTKKLNPIQEIDLKMCRICNASKGEISIFDNLVHPNISEDIKHFSGVSISRTDHLPKHICQNCLNLLNGCILFRDMCQSNNKILVELSIKKGADVESNKYLNTSKTKKKELCDEVLLPGTIEKCTTLSNNEGESSSAQVLPPYKLRESEINNSEVGTKLAQESDDSYNIPSPTFSEDNSEIWGCTTCNKEFFDMVSYNTHLKSCNKTISEGPKEQSEDGHKKTFLCDICGKTARSNANLLVHMGIHENVFPFKCDQCPYQGRTMDLLKVHKRTHLADKPFKCTQCPKSTTTSSNLAKHMRHVHSTTRPYKCSYCDKAFSYQHDMKRHIRDIHLRQGTVECDVCFKKFNTKKILQGHRWKIHKIKGERHGRLPSYLQCQLGDDNENKSSDNEPIVY